MSLLVRIAKLSDLPTIHNLIIDSFAAMNDFFDSDNNMTRKYAQQAIDGDLNPTNFESAYTKCPPNNFWVVEQSDSNQVHGCVALKRINNHEAELVRMAVTPENRSRGYGSVLIKSLISFAILQGFHRIILTTANPKSMTFYLKHDFVIANQTDVALPGTGKTLPVFKMVKYLSEKLIESVAIVGGTHGNERIGVNLVNEWLGIKQNEIKRSSFITKVIHGNPKAIEANTRFIDIDLNRQFETLDIVDKNTTVVKATADKYEHTRAVELNTILGPKVKPFHHNIAASDSTTDITVSNNKPSHTEPEVEFIIDLHSSESNVGIVLMISGEEDCLAYRVAHFITTEIDRFEDVNVTCSRGDKSKSYSVDSIASSGLAIEVGPIQHGQCNTTTADHNDAVLLERTRDLVLTILTYFENKNLALLHAVKEHSSSLDAAEHSSVPTSTVANVSNTNNNNDLNQVKVVSVDQARSLVHRSVFPKLNYFRQLGTIYFPTTATPTTSTTATTTATLTTSTTATSTGDAPSSTTTAMNEEISMDSVTEEVNEAIIYHPSFYSATHRHQDLTLLHVGDTVFQSIKTIKTARQTPRKRLKNDDTLTEIEDDTVLRESEADVNGEVILTTDIPLILPDNIRSLLPNNHQSTGSGSGGGGEPQEQPVVYPLFINEPAYASSRFAFSLFTLETKSIY